VVALTRITSLGSLSAAVLVMVLALLGLGMGWVEPTYTAFLGLAGGAVVVLHRSNIRRLLDGTENRVQRFF
jgi:glycerol-3-phosphate acyltransferase PlsY